MRLHKSSALAEMIKIKQHLHLLVSIVNKYENPCRKYIFYYSALISHWKEQTAAICLQESLNLKLGWETAQPTFSCGNQINMGCNPTSFMLF